MWPRSRELEPRSLAYRASRSSLVRLISRSKAAVLSSRRAYLSSGCWNLGSVIVPTGVCLAVLGDDLAVLGSLGQEE